MSLEKNTKMRKAQYFGHLITNDKMQKIVVERKNRRKDAKGMPKNVEAISFVLKDLINVLFLSFSSILT